MRRTLLVAVLLLPCAAQADPLADFNDAVERAAAHQRAAVAHLHARERDAAVTALVRLAAAWQDIATRFGNPRPAAFENNPHFGTLMVDIPLRIVTARMMIDLGRAEPAISAIDSIRQALSQARRASHVEVLADCIVDANGAVDALASVSGPAALGAAADAYLTTVRRCDAMAPDSVQRDRAFRHAVESAEETVARLKMAAAAGDTAGFRAAIEALRANDARLSQRFG